MSSGELDARRDREEYVAALKAEYESQFLPEERGFYTFEDYIIFRLYDAGIPAKGTDDVK